MLTDREVEEAAQQLADYRRRDTLADVLATYQDLLEKYKRLKSDYEEERDAREKYKQLSKQQERNPFVLVLVDGDGYVFDDALISEGANGGSTAASLLDERINESLRRKGLEHCDVMVRIYADVVGVSKSMSKAGLIGAEKRSLAPFIANFNRSKALFDYVDAGELKENADFKLRGLLRLYAENAQCKHIFFAACHDVGYVSELTQYRNNRERFTLIKTPGLLFHHEFTRLGLGIEELPQVFRPSGSAMDAYYPKPLQPASQNANNKSVAGVTPPTAPASPAAAKNQPQGPGEICHFFKHGKCRYGLHCKNAHPQTSVLPVRTSTRLSQDWRTENGLPALDHGIGSGSPVKPAKNYLPQPEFDIGQLPKKQDIPDGYVAINKYKQRLDAYIPPPTPEAESRLRARSAVQRLCNAKHLVGACNNAGRCDYDHAPLEEDLRPALEWLSRSLPCPQRNSCRDAACTSGHVCQKQDCKHRGGKTFCKLGYTMHDIDLTADEIVPGVARRRMPPAAAHYNSNGGGVENNYSVASRHSSLGPASPASEEEDDEDRDDLAGSGGSILLVD